MSTNIFNLLVNNLRKTKLKALINKTVHNYKAMRINKNNKTTEKIGLTKISYKNRRATKI